MGNAGEATGFIFSYTLAMRRCFVGLLACLSLSAQTPRNLYQSHCSGCHGPAGEGSRGPALRVAALQRANDVESLVALLRRGVPGTEMPATAQQVIADEPQSPAVRWRAFRFQVRRDGAALPVTRRRWRVAVPRRARPVRGSLRRRARDIRSSATDIGYAGSG